MKIQELFQKPIDRQINGVIKAEQTDDLNICQELEEYVSNSHYGKLTTVRRES